MTTQDDAPPAGGAEARIKDFFESVPHCRALGMRIDQVAQGRAVLSMPWDPALVGDPASGVIHGGAISALMDTASGAAVMSHPDTAPTATLDLRIDYMRPARPGARLIAEAEVYRMTRHVAFLRAVAHDGEKTPPVATATGAFTVIHVAPSGAAKAEGGR